MDMPVSIPLHLKVKGLKQVTDLLVALSNRTEIIMTNVERLSVDLDEIAGDITTIKDAAAVTIQALRDELAAAVAGADAATQAAVTAAVDKAAAASEATLKPLVDKADALNAENPAVVPPVEPPVEVPPVEPPVVEVPPVDVVPNPDVPQV